MQRVFVALFALVGCGLIHIAQPGEVTDGPEGHHVQLDGRTYRVGPYWGPECERIGAYKNEVNRGETEAAATAGKQPNLAQDPADQILRLVCVEEIYSSEDEPDRDTWVTQHFRFDEISF